MMTTGINDGETNSREFGRTDYIKITIFGFALAALWSSIHSIILPIRLLDFVAESAKNTHLGMLTFVGLIVALMVQPIAGALSDQSDFPWGRRRPYIFIGTIVALLFIPGVGLVGSYVTIFIVYCLLQVSTNTAQGSYQAFIPDLVPVGKRGLASGVKTLLEILGGVVFLYPLALFMDNYFIKQEAYWLWLALGSLGIVVIAAMIATLYMVKERPGSGGVQLPASFNILRSFRIDFKADRAFVWFLLSRLLIIMAFTTLQTFALYFLRDVVGVSNPATATAQFSIVAVAGMLAVVYPAGRLSDRIGRRRIAIASALLGALGVALILLFRENYLFIVCCGGIVGISFGAFMSTNWALATDLVARGEEARYLAMANVATAGGAALARLIGPVIDFFNSYGDGFGYSVMLLACISYFIIGSALLVKVQEPQPK